MIGPWWLPILPALAVAAIYAWGVRRLTSRGDSWPVNRSVFFAVGVLLALVSVLPPLADPPTFVLHVLQHLLLAMAAPFALALSGPFTLALRTLPPRPRRLLLRLLHSRLATAAMSAPLVLILEVGGMYAYYLTGLFPAAEQHPGLHLLVHGHMFLTGCLFSWYLLAVDPIRNRPSTITKVIVLALASSSHDVLAKLMYARGAPTSEPRAEVHAGAQLLFYGGDVIDLLLMTAVLTAWYARTGRELARQRRRATQTATRPTVMSGPPSPHQPPAAPPAASP